MCLKTFSFALCQFIKVIGDTLPYQSSDSRFVETSIFKTQPLVVVLIIQVVRDFFYICAKVNDIGAQGLVTLYN